MNMLSQKLHHPIGRWSFFSVNPNLGGAAKLPKNRFEQKMGKIRDKRADLPKIARHTEGG
jgi:hypothetical protein